MFPAPVPGLVIRYSYLWQREHLQGREEGVKDRPCAIVVATQDHIGETVVTVLPITHTPPSDMSLAVEIPPLTKQRLKLDDQPSWIVLAEANRFVWPGPDLRMGERGNPDSIAYGLLPRGLFNDVRDKLASALVNRLAAVVPRTE